MAKRNWLTDLLKGRPERSDRDAPPSPTHSRQGESRQTITYQHEMAAHSAARHPIVYRCLNKIANSVASVGWYAEKDPDSDKSVSQKELDKITDVLKYPNDSMTANQYRYWMAMVYACYGRVPGLVGKSDDKTPNAIYTLDAAQMSAKTNDRGMIVGYEYGKNTEKVVYRTRRTAGERERYAFEIFRPGP